jgi:hypothetical protein
MEKPLISVSGFFVAVCQMIDLSAMPIPHFPFGVTGACEAAM